ncbi:hypothetical protein EMPG_16936 [Blastomyces silverae]|uniref:Zn(2)-C6 fungal-type domain-containing protein n=1 Tax=Blastomyces silverae TaxID=2060906 RepID=A0A0H1B908_9EURO|nr:hypothetical protein EMPG_16936 [Blastomyces silverae]
MPSSKHVAHLPLIAPKDNAIKSAESGVKPGNKDEQRVKMPVRVRLPPRSRTGCWTCRSRKVKCDEGHPTCGQCSRLGHECDYSPRLAFRDDTSRIKQRMQAVSTAGNAVWDPKSPTLTASSPNSSIGGDTLPPFACLTSDLEREMKAEAHSPGTYHVIVNPESFSALPEYCDTTDNTSMSSSPGSDKDDTIKARARKRNRRHTRHNSSLTETGDPNVVILSKFEDSIPISSPGHWRNNTRPSPSRSSTSGSKSSAELVDELPLQDFMETFSPSYIDTTEQCGEDTRLLLHFRRVVWSHLVQTATRSESPAHGVGNAPGADIFEQEAATFRPLFHAMMAVSALSLSHQEKGQSIAALQHYQQTLPFLQTSMRSHQDLSSDGVFLTHFLLLIYEIAAAEPGGSNLWSHHLERLLRIFLMRNELFKTEKFPFIIWWVCSIDLYALFSGTGTGEFIGAVLKNDMIPSPRFHLYPLGPDGTSIIYPEERGILPTILQFNHDIFVLAARLGLLASEFRTQSTYANGTAMNTTNSDSSHGFPPQMLADREKRLFGIQQAFRHLWVTSNLSVLEQQMDLLPSRSKEMLQHSTTLFHASLIYSYTSMWPGQCIETGGGPALEISQRTTAILQVVSSIVHAGRFDLRFIVFPLFMAGVASSSSSQKMLALDLLSSIEGNESVGRNVTTTRHVLQIVYQRQTEGYMRKGHALDVDWVEIMIEQGLQMVNFGL